MSEQSAAAQSALRTINAERGGLDALIEALGNGLAEPFAKAVQTLAAGKGRVIVTGVGKSGHIGSKIAATLASTTKVSTRPTPGTPSSPSPPHPLTMPSSGTSWR